MKHLRYYREFKDAENATYRVELWQEAEEEYIPQEVMLAADPVVIEWGEVTKLDPVMGSGATLKLISMSDRQFVDLYTVEIGAIRMIVYRNGQLYWSGTIDTELYEEPYSQKNRYVTEVTFSDFGALERISWQERGLMTLEEVINKCLESAQVSYIEVVKYISTTIPTADGELELLGNCKVSCENFYDENGEAWNMREALEEVLRPFALRIKQKNGKIIIADLNAFYDAPSEAVGWCGGDSTLSVEPTYNKVIIHYSPYSQADLFDGTFDEEKILPNANDPTDILAPTTIVVPLPETSYAGFRAHISRKYGATTEVQGLNVHENACLFRIEPVNDASASAGVAWGARGPLNDWVGNTPKTQTKYDPYSSRVLMSTPRIPLQRTADWNQIRISLDLLCDPRANPFEDASEDNNQSEWKAFDKGVNFGMVPCAVVLYGADGETYDYTNGSLFDTSYDRKFWEYYNENKGRWVKRVNANNPCWLSYYNEGDREEKTGLGGWQTNKQTLGCYTGKTIPKDISLNIAGEKIPMPPVAGELEVRVYAGLWLSSGVVGIDASDEVVNSLRWVVYKDLQVDVVTNSGKVIDVEDVEVSAWLNKAAESEMSIDTYIGTADKRLPLARGSVINANSEPITRLARAGQTSSIENLLAGTVYSQYASRVSAISATIKLIPDEVVLLNKLEVNSRYVALSATEHLSEARTEVKMAEFNRDSYEGIEYE